MNPSKKKFYAVRTGRTPGIYATWDECKTQIDGFTHARYKGFATRAEAEDYLNGIETREPPKTVVTVPQASQPDSFKSVVIFTDGACSGNPGRGGYGAIIRYKGNEKEISGGFRRTTNNRMEIMGCIAALQLLKEPCAVVLCSDSQYVINAMTKSWAERWRQNGWKRRENGGWKDALNSDLWEQMLELCDKHNVRFEWVRGHSGHKENERCDELARAAAASDNLAIDTGYERAARMLD